MKLMLDDIPTPPCLSPRPDGMCCELPLGHAETKHSRYVRGGAVLQWDGMVPATITVPYDECPALFEAILGGPHAPLELLLWCPFCGERHVDPPDREPHRTHACQECGALWAPAVVHTVGVAFLPGCLDERREPRG